MKGNYLQENNLFIRREIYPLVTQVDTLIFDIDGVLVDVSSSYYQTIMDTVQYYFGHFIPVSGDGNLVDRDMILNFKMAGGFNDDWELTAAVILYYLWKMKEYRLNSLPKLKDSSSVIRDFLVRNLSGGGLSQLVQWIKSHVSSPDEIFGLWNKEKIFRIAKEYYAGEEHCFRLYQFQPEQLKKVKGNIEQEMTLVKPEVTSLIKRYHVGIFTGRNQGETEIVLERISWNDSWLPSEAIITSEDIVEGKPNPEGLRFLFEKFESKTGVYIGDTMDDLLTVTRLNEEGFQRRCLSALVLGRDFSDKKETVPYYLKHQVDLLAEDVNQVIQWIHQKNQVIGKFA